MSKRINKILWHGDELENNKAKAPHIATEENGLDGLNEGELYISNNENDPALFTLTSSGKVVRVGVNHEELKKIFLSKVEDDKASGKITFKQGAEYGDYTTSATGACIKQDANGNWLVETDNLFVRKKATFTSVEIQDVHHVGGQLLLTSASAVIDLVTELSNGYKCYFRNVDSEGNTITNDWMVGDQAYCNTFNIQKQSDGKAENHYYWRKVTGKGTEGDFHYIILSKDESGEIEGRTFNDAPLEGDNIVQLGYQGSDDPDRQNAIIIAGAGQDNPYIYQFTGIDSFTLPEPETKIKPGDNLFTGVMNIQAGSTGAGNLTDIGDTITREAEKFAYGKYNLLRNTSFRGDYTSANLAEDSEMGDASVYSQALTYWSVANGNVSVQESEVAELKREIRLNGAIQQTLVSPLIAGESYVCSFRAKGAYVAFSVSGISLRQSLTDEYKRYVLKFTAGNAGQVFSLVGNATVCDIQLERGNMASAWGLSVYDNGHELEYMQALDYLATAIKDGDTEILGGLLLTSIIKVGKYLDGKMEANTAGISGIYNDDDDVAFWGGGTFEQAIKTVSRFRNNPNYTPTEEEWKSMANYVVTHGGDSFLRGYIYALGGVFRGTVYAKDGEFTGIVHAKDGEFTGIVHAKDGDFTGTITALNVVHKFRELHVASNIELEINEQGASIHLIPEIQQWTVTLPPAENYKYRELSLYVSPIITRSSLTCDVVAREDTGFYWRGRGSDYVDVTFKRYTLPYGSITKFISLQGKDGAWSWFIDSDTIVANLQIS